MRFYLSKIPSPMGELLLVTDDQEQVRALDFADHKARVHQGLREHYATHELVDGPAPAAIATAIANYFRGDLNALRDIVTVTGGSDFQRRVWKALLDIPAGPNDQLRPVGSGDRIRRPACGDRRGGRHRCQPRGYHRAMSSGYRQQRRHQGLCRRHASQALATGARRCAGEDR